MHWLYVVWKIWLHHVNVDIQESWKTGMGVPGNLVYWLESDAEHGYWAGFQTISDDFRFRRFSRNRRGWLEIRLEIARGASKTRFGSVGGSDEGGGYNTILIALRDVRSVGIKFQNYFLWRFLVIATPDEIRQNRRKSSRKISFEGIGFYKKPLVNFLCWQT